jgi:hypothetical protein
MGPVISDSRLDPENGQPGAAASVFGAAPCRARWAERVPAASFRSGCARGPGLSAQRLLAATTARRPEVPPRKEGETPWPIAAGEHCKEKKGAR